MSSSTKGVKEDEVSPSGEVAEDLHKGGDGPSQSKEAEPEAVVAVTDVAFDKYAGGGVIPHGARGQTVMRLQEALGAPVTGIFDGHTESALRSAQASRKLPVTGICDEPTRRALSI